MSAPPCLCRVLAMGSRSPGHVARGVAPCRGIALPPLCLCLARHLAVALPCLGRVVAVWRPCPACLCLAFAMFCHAFARSLPCLCPVFAMHLPWPLPWHCQCCHAFAMCSPCAFAMLCHAFVMSLSCLCHVVWPCLGHAFAAWSRCLARPLPCRCPVFDHLCAHVKHLTRSVSYLDPPKSVVCCVLCVVRCVLCSARCRSMCVACGVLGCMCRYVVCCVTGWVCPQNPPKGPRSANTCHTHGEPKTRP